MAERPTDQASERIARQYWEQSDPTDDVWCDVLIVNSRGTAHPWLLAAQQSVKEQSYKRIGMLILDNNDHGLSIGTAYNQLVSASDANMVLFLSDDDLLSIDLTASLVAAYQQGKAKVPSLVHVTTNSTLIYEANGTRMNAPVQHLGLFDRSWLLTNRFNEALTKGTHIDMVRRMERFAEFQRAPLSMCMAHHFGYVFRQHIGQASGMVMLPGMNGTPAMRKA